MRIRGTLMTALWTALWLGACVQPGLQAPGPAPDGGDGVCTPAAPGRALDLLFVIDNSGSMGDRQMALSWEFTTLLDELRAFDGGLPDLHLGVVSTDLGAGDALIHTCEAAGGDGGRLLTGTCGNPVGAPYLVDVAPRGCGVTRDGAGRCDTHACGPAHCDHEPSATLVLDDQGCPRCRNFEGEPLDEAFGCVASLGSLGCGFEQPLEAMRRALDANPENAGFEREDALLTVVFLTDEDDCSVADNTLFTDPEGDLSSPLGPFTSYRCFEFGVTCDENDRTVPGTRTGCVPREDGLLYPVSRYVEFLRGHKDPGRLVVAALAGPYDGLVQVALNETGYPAVQTACVAGHFGTAIPAVRMRAFIDALYPPGDRPWSFASVCGDHYLEPLRQLGGHLVDTLQGEVCAAGGTP